LQLVNTISARIPNPGVGGSNPLGRAISPGTGRERKKIETLFGDVKRNLGLTRLRLRGLTGARDEFLLAATVQNLKRLTKLAAKTIPPKPSRMRFLVGTPFSGSMDQIGYLCPL